MKKFNKLLKKKADDILPASSSAGANMINLEDARAEYYASRNPFMDSPANNNNSNNNNRGANPFADSDSDEDMLAGFARKKTGGDVGAPTSSSGGAKPSGASRGDSGGAGRPMSGSANASSVGGDRNIGGGRSHTSNPFDDASVNDKVMGNPFDDDETDAVAAKSGGRSGAATVNTNSVRRGAPTNPFGEETSASPRVHVPPGNSRDDNKNNNPFDSPPRRASPKASDKSNPFDSPQKSTTTRPPAHLSGSVVPVQPIQSGGRQSNQKTIKTMPSKPSVPQRSVSHGQVENLASYPSVTHNPSTLTAAGKQPKLWRGFSASDDTESTRPILEHMDDDETTAASPIVMTSSLNLQKGPTANAAGLASWLRLNKKEDEEVKPMHHTHNKITHSKSMEKSKTKKNNNTITNKRTKKKCKAVITAWPFDNFHQIQEQQMMYEELASRAASEYTTIKKTKEDQDDTTEEYPQLSDEESREEENHPSAITMMNHDNAKYYERPEELPSIKEAVTNLPLVDFEKKAEERAINIVSSWLFDAGLIDELLVNGAMPPQRPPSSPDNRTVKSQEGVEIGQHGFPLLGSEGAAELKMDKETNKLRGMIQRDLSIINARLNDGVAASGLEVRELVNAVAATKEDIGRLRELTTYISDSQMSDRDEFLLAKYPHLRRAIHARRNINRCFRELEFFSQIPSTCDRLRDELHGGEWTEEEWSTIRNVAMEHVELEIMLVEAEVSMKAGRNFNDAMVDNFLDSHVQNVWELGDEIRMRMLSGIGSAFDLAINNPAGMVALVEAVEVYEKAAETFEKKRHESGMADSGKLRFTNMRAAALEQLYQDFELRGVEMFRGVHEQAADIADEEDASNTQFTAVLKAATELVTEIDIVKHQMSPCFAPHWHVEALWSSCVAHVCSNHIVQQIGGPDGQNLPELTITQLLELVAWVEYFRETIEETFPEVAEMHDTKKTYFEERPDLFGADRRTVNMRNATDSLAWVNNMLWEVHRLAQEEFLVRTRSQTDEWLEKVYESETVKNQSSEGKLTTSLCEDVFSFSSVQLRTIRERLSKKSDALILAVCVILSHMRSKQVHSRNHFLQDLETCCAASNDFTRMSEKCEDVCTDLISQCEFSEDMIATVEASSNELMVVYSSDAVYAARSVHIYVFDPIEEEIGTRLFEQAWEEDMVGNDLALSLIRTLEDFYDDLVHFMDDFMVVKSVMSLMSATVIFYVKCLLTRAERHRSNKKPYFGDVQTALNRMTGDIKVMREYFDGLVPKMPALKKNIEKDFEILSTVHELMSIAAGMSISEAEDFILVLQKRVRDVSITKHIVGDLWHLVAPTDERYVWELVESMEEQLVAIAPADDALALEVNDRSYVKGLRLDEMAVKLYVKSKRHRPVKSTATEKIINNWRTTWAVRAEDGTIDDNKDLY